jgi:hypothetical protein
MPDSSCLNGTDQKVDLTAGETSVALYREIRACACACDRTTHSPPFLHCLLFRAALTGILPAYRQLVTALAIM